MLRWLLFHQELDAADMKLIVEYQILSYFLLLLLLLTSKSAHEVTNRSFQLKRNITLPALSKKGRNITLPAVSVDTSVCFVSFFSPGSLYSATTAHTNKQAFLKRKGRFIPIRLETNC